MNLSKFYLRAKSSAVLWSWVFNGVRLGYGLILLPLILNKLPTTDLGMYYVLLSLAALVPLVDFGFGPTVGRFVSYAMGGAETIQAHGVARPGASTAPNYALLWELLLTTRRLYRYLVLLLFVILGVWGTYVVELRIHETSSVILTRLAWAATLATALFDIYTNWWLVYLRSLNEVTAAAKLPLLTIMVRLVIAAGLLLAGAGLLSLPIGMFFGSFLQQQLTRRACLKLLPPQFAPEKVDVKKNLRILWPNTWRLGLQFISSYLTVNANTAICLYVLGLAANAQYGLSVQLLTILNGMACVWTLVKWPLIGQCHARHDFDAVQRILWPRVWLQSFTFLAGCAALLVCGPFLLRHFGGGKVMLPREWMVLMMLNGFLEMQFAIWGTLISLENRLPHLWPLVATNCLSLALSLVLVKYTSLGLGGLVLGPLVSGLLFHYWYWPFYAARRLGTNLVRFLFVGPEQKKPEPALVTES